MAKGEPLSMDMKLVGFNDTMRAVRKTEPELAKQARKAIGEAATIIKKDAQAHYSDGLPHARNWRSIWPQKFPPWNNRTLTRGDKGWPAFLPNEMRRAVKVSWRKSRQERGRLLRTSVAIRSASPAAAVLEFAKRSRGSKQFPYVNSLPFVNALGGYQGGRVLWAAFERNKEQVGKKIRTGVAQLESAIQKQIDAAKDVS